MCVCVCGGKLRITIAAFLIKANKDGCYGFITSQRGKMKPNMNAVLLHEGLQFVSKAESELQPQQLQSGAVSLEV